MLLYLVWFGLLHYLFFYSCIHLASHIPQSTLNHRHCLTQRLLSYYVCTSCWPDRRFIHYSKTHRSKINFRSNAIRSYWERLQKTSFYALHRTSNDGLGHSINQFSSILEKMEAISHVNNVFDKRYSIETGDRQIITVNFQCKLHLWLAHLWLGRVSRRLRGCTVH